MKLIQAIVLAYLILTLQNVYAAKHLDSEAFLACSTLYAYHAYILKSFNYPNKQEIEKLKNQTDVFLLSSSAIEGKQISKARFQESSKKTYELLNKILKEKGGDAYFSEYKNRNDKCAKLANKYSEEIWTLIDKMQKSGG